MGAWRAVSVELPRPHRCKPRNALRRDPSSRSRCAGCGARAASGCRAIDRLLQTECRRHSDGARPAHPRGDRCRRSQARATPSTTERSSKSLGHTPPPRWDLIDIRDYRAMMMQTTVGCRFRCDFCDIIQFNGGFTRPKTLESVRDELGALLRVQATAAACSPSTTTSSAIPRRSSRSST